MRGESESEEIVLKGVGKGSQRIEKVQKKPSEKDKLKAAELLGKRFGMFSGGGSDDNKVLEKLDEVLGGIKSEF
jgi:Terminase small subunit.